MFNRYALKAFLAAFSLSSGTSAGVSASASLPDDFKFVEVTDPMDNPEGRYVEFYSATGAGDIIGTRSGEDVYLVLVGSPISNVKLTGHTMKNTGYFIVCKDKTTFKDLYGDVDCDLEAPDVANNDGSGYDYWLGHSTENSSGVTTFSLIDQCCGYSTFKDGRAERKQDSSLPSNGAPFDATQWNINENVNYVDMDPGYWIGSQLDDDLPNDFRIVEIAEPKDDEEGRYIEFFTETGAGKVIGRVDGNDVNLVFFGFAGFITVRLTGSMIRDDGFFIVCFSKSKFNSLYDSDDGCDLEAPDLASLFGYYIVHIKNDSTQRTTTIDNFEYPPIDDLRAVRKKTAGYPTDTFDTSQWTVISDANVEDMSPRSWIGEPCEDEVKESPNHPIGKDCDWVSADKAKRCPRHKKRCPRTCGVCPCQDNAFRRFSFPVTGKKDKMKKCRWVSKNSDSRCESEKAKKNCQETCKDECKE